MIAEKKYYTKSGSTADGYYSPKIYPSEALSVIVCEILIEPTVSIEL
jgi:hypothetical protein